MSRKYRLEKVLYVDKMESPVLKKRKIDGLTLEDSSMDGVYKSTEQMNSSEDSFKGGINRLPVEILIKIIVNLPLEDRKNTRLVSRRWYDLNNIRQISTKEKFLCYGVYGLDSVLQTLESSRKDILNLQFIHFDFSTNTDHWFEFWRNNGWKIESLSFSHCVLSEETVEQVIINCDKMRYFAIENPLFRPCERYMELISAPAPTFRNIMAVRRENLHSFILKFTQEAEDERWVSADFLRVIFYVYPNIDNFSFISPSLMRDVICTTMIKTNEDWLQTDEKFIFASILKKLADSRKMMRSINLDTSEIELDFSTMLYDFPKLTSIRLNSRPKHMIFDFLSRHNYLRFIEFKLELESFKDSDCLFLERLMNCLLDSYTQLESLKIEISDEIFLEDERIFEKIKNSKLRSLYLNFLLKAPHSDENANTITNKTLKYLHLSHPSIESFSLDRYGMINAFVKTFRGLSELTIDRDDVGNDVLQDIFLYQRQLTSLKLWSLGVTGLENIVLTDYGFTGVEPNGHRTGYSIKDLKNLKHLELSRWYKVESREFFKELKFAKLSILSLHFRISQELLGTEEFVTTFSNLPNLEKLVFKGGMKFHPSLWLEICQQLKKLRFLYIETSFPSFHVWRFPDHCYERFFQKCPTLSVLHRCKVPIYNEDDLIYYNRIYSYHLDPVTKRVNVVKEADARDDYLLLT